MMLEVFAHDGKVAGFLQPPDFAWRHLDVDDSEKNWLSGMDYLTNPAGVLAPLPDKNLCI